MILSGKLRVKVAGQFYEMGPGYGDAIQGVTEA